LPVDVGRYGPFLWWREGRLNVAFETRRGDYRIGDWHLDVAARELVGARRRVRLEPLSLKLLLVLIQAEGRVVPRDTLVEKVWGRRVVTDDAFGRQLAKLRAALAEDESAAGAIETVPKTGLRLVVPAVRILPRPEQTRSRPDRRFLVAAIAAGLLVLIGAILLLRPAPGEAVRIRPFTAQLGEEIEPAISPDGRWVVYAARDNADARFGLYLRALDGDVARRITGPEFGARRPAWSPSGRRIAFLSRSADGCVVAVGAPRSGYRPVAGCMGIEAGLAWLDEDALIVADRSDYGVPVTLRRVDLRGGREQALTSQPAGVGGDGDPLVAADGLHVYFVRVAAPGVGRLMEVDLRTRATREISAEPAAISGLTYGRRGRLLVAATRQDGDSGLWEVDPAAGTWRLVEAGEGTYPAATRDGAMLLFEQSAMSGSVWMQRASTGQAWQLTNSTRFDRQPALSPDRRQLAFISNRSGTSELWLRDMAHGTERRALRNGALAPMSFAWSPRSDRLVVAGRDADAAGLFILVPGSGRVERLRSDGNEFFPAFSADGTRLLFTRRAGSRFAVFERNLGSGADRILVADAVRVLPGPGNVLLFSRPFEAGLWRLVPASRRAGRISAAPAVPDRLNWAIAGDAIWVVDRAAGRLLRLGLDGRVRESRSMPALAPSSGLSVTGDYLLYAQRSPPETDLMLMVRGGG
jgi:Tol biopolymer transport system component/DNA-binding winged helix-turn-helix (wHTH) protein